MREVCLKLRGTKPGRLAVCFTDADGTTPEEIVTLRGEEISAFARLRDAPDVRQQDRCVELLHALLRRAPLAWERLERYLPDGPDDLSPADRLLVEAADPQALGIPVELLSTRTANGPTRPLIATDRWQIDRYAPIAAPSGDAPVREPRLMVVIGSTTQPLDRQTARPLVLELLREFTSAARATIAIPVHEHRHLLATARVGEDDEVRALLNDGRRCRTFASVGALGELLADPAHRAEIVVLLGHSIEDGGEASHFDLGLERIDSPSGLSFGEIAQAMAHGETRLIVAMACVVGPAATLELLRTVDHVVATHARVRVEDAAEALAVMREVLLVERAPLDRAVRRMRRAFRSGFGWMLWHTTRTRSNRVLVDPLAIAVREYLGQARDDHERELRETLIAGRLELLVSESIKIAGDDSGAAAEFARGRRRPGVVEDLLGSTTLRALLEAIQLDSGPQYLVVLGRPGAGKSVLLQDYALELARQDPPGRIPVFIRVRELIDEAAPGTDFLDFVVGRQRGLGPESVRKDDPLVMALRSAIETRRAVFLLDGIDEVPPGVRDALLRRARSLGAESGCPIVLTSRPIGFACPAGFRELWLQPLDGARQRELVTKRHGAEAPRILAVIESRRVASPSFGHLASNPLFLTLLSDLARDGEPIESRELEVLEQIIDFLVEQRNKPAALRERLRFARSDLVVLALRSLALWLTVAAKSVAGEAEVRAWAAARTTGKGAMTPRVIEERLRDCGDWAGGDWPDFLTTVAERAGVLVARSAGGRRTFEFRHRAFQEALCAREIISRWPKLDLARMRAVITESEAAAADLVNYWSEPIALLTAQVADADAWILGLARVAQTRPIALRALASARHLEPRSIVSLVQALPDWRDRATVYEQLIERTDRDRIAGIVAGVARRVSDGNDRWHLRRLSERLLVAGVSGARELRAQVLRSRGLPDASPLVRKPTMNGTVSLWRRCDADSGWPYFHAVEWRESHMVIPTMAPFLMMRAPVTVGQYRMFDASKRSPWGGDPDLPRTGLTALEAESFGEWLNEHRARLAAASPEIAKMPADYRFRLPRELELWRCAYWNGRFPLPRSRDGRPHPLDPSLLEQVEFADLVGSVEQWCYRDWIDSSEDLPYACTVFWYEQYWDWSELQSETRAPCDTVNRHLAQRGLLGHVLRGGSFWQLESECTTEARVLIDPDRSRPGSGLRVVLGPPLDPPS